MIEGARRPSGAIYFCLPPGGLCADTYARLTVHGDSEKTGAAVRTISRILSCHGVPPLAWLDLMTVISARAALATANRYEHRQRGELCTWT